MEAITIGTIWLQSISLLFRTQERSPSISLPALLESPILRSLKSIFLLTPPDIDIVNNYLERYRFYFDFGFRTEYIVVNLLFPMILCFFALALFKPLPTILGYISFLLFVISFSSFVYMVLLQYININQANLKAIDLLQESYLNAWFFLLAAVIFFTLAAFFFIVRILDWKLGLWARFPRVGDVFESLFARFMNWIKSLGRRPPSSKRRRKKPSRPRNPILLSTSSPIAPQYNRSRKRKAKDANAVRVTVRPSKTKETPTMVELPRSDLELSLPDSKSSTANSQLPSHKVTHSPHSPNAPPLKEIEETILPRNHKKGYVVTQVVNKYEEFEVTTFKERLINEFQEQRKLEHRLNCYRIGLAILIGSILFIIGLVLLITIQEYIGGGVLMAVGIGAILIFVPVLLLKRGRIFLFWVRYQLLEKWAVFFLLILVQVLYTPFMTSIFSSFACTEMTCPSGTRFVDVYNGISSNIVYRSAVSDLCEPCHFYGNSSSNGTQLSAASWTQTFDTSFATEISSITNSSTCPFASQLCPEVTRRRLLADPTLDCENDLMVYFWPASIITGALYAFALPILYYILTRRSLSILKRMEVDSLLWRNLPDHIKQQAKKLTARNYVKHLFHSAKVYVTTKLGIRKSDHQKNQVGLWAPELHSMLQSARESSTRLFRRRSIMNSLDKSDQKPAEQSHSTPNSSRNSSKSSRKSKRRKRKHRHTKVHNFTPNSPEDDIKVSDVELLISDVDGGSKRPHQSRKRSSSDVHKSRNTRSTRPGRRRAASVVRGKPIKNKDKNIRVENSPNSKIVMLSDEPNSLIQTSAGAFRPDHKSLFSSNVNARSDQRNNHGDRTSSQLKPNDGNHSSTGPFSMTQKATIRRGSTQRALLAFGRSPSRLKRVYSHIAKRAQLERKKTGEVPLVTPSGIVYVRDPNQKPQSSQKKKRKRTLIRRLCWGFMHHVFGWGYNEEKELWQIRINLSMNPVRALYYSFHYNARYFKIVVLFYKLLLVAVTISFFSSPVTILSIVLVLHMLLLGFILLSRPYIFTLETILHIAATIICVVNTIYMLLVVTVDMPDAVAYPVLTLNLLFFIIVFLVLFLSCGARLKFTWKYNQLFKKTRKFQNHITKIGVEDKIADNHANINYKLTRTNLDMVVSFFMIMGLTLTLALFLCILSMFRHEFRTDHYPSLQRAYLSQDSSRCDTVRKFQFAGYSSWEEFSTHCCCSKSDMFVDSIHENRYTSVEMWYCLNGERKERIRQQMHNGESLSGEDSIRSFCSSEFLGGYYVDECGTLLKNESFTGGSHRQATAYEEAYLW